MARIQLYAHMKPSFMLKRMMSHQGDLSQGSKTKILAKRIVLGKEVILYENGSHLIKDKIDLTEEEMFHSNILRYVHASILINEPVGHKAKLYIDATVNPVIVWLYGVPAEKFLRRAKLAINSGEIEADCILDQHPAHSEGEINYVGNVRLP